jgi:hypothetical protein
VIPALAAALAIVVQDHASLRTAPRATAPELIALPQGELIEVRGERGGYLKVYDYRRERGGFLRTESARAIGLGPRAAPELLAVLRFLRDSPGSEALGISYGAAYLKAAPLGTPLAEPLDAIARMAERLADQASGLGARRAGAATRLEVAEGFGIHVHTLEREGRMQVCYDGEFFRRVLQLPDASPEQRATAALALTRPECLDPQAGPLLRATLDAERRRLLEGVADADLTPVTRARLHARRAAVWASTAWEAARAHAQSTQPAQRALAELLAVHPDELGDDRRAEYRDALVRVSAIRWAAGSASPLTGPLLLRTRAGDPGQTCVELVQLRDARETSLAQRCTYGIVWNGSARAIPQGPALALAVQPLETWRELWLFHEVAGAWEIDVVSPGLDDPVAGYAEFAGFVPATRRVLVVREVQERGGLRRHFEELRLDDLALMRQATAAELLPDFGRWQDPDWRRDSLALH